MALLCIAILCKVLLKLSFVRSQEIWSVVCFLLGSSWLPLLLVKQVTGYVETIVNIMLFKDG